MSEIDGFTAFAILVRALGYAGGLVAVGSGLFLAVYAGRAFPGSDPAVIRRSMRQTAWIGGTAAIVAAAATCAGVGVRAGRLSGLDFAGMTDPMMLQIVLEGPVGTAVAWRLAALAAILAALAIARATVGRGLAIIAAAGYAWSYTVAGHASEGPPWLLPAVLTVHLMAAAFWIGSFAPLAMVARRAAILDAAGLLETFGRTAVVVVAALIAAGATFAFVLVRSPAGLFGSAYGLILVAKLAVVTLLLALAAINKLVLVPSLARGREDARDRLTRSIAFEGGAALVILLATGVLTSVATPPDRADGAVSALTRRSDAGSSAAASIGLRPRDRGILEHQDDRRIGWKSSKLIARTD